MVYGVRGGNRSPFPGDRSEKIKEPNLRAEEPMTVRYLHYMFQITREGVAQWS